jgi:flagellar biosynthesis protein FlhA
MKKKLFSPVEDPEASALIIDSCILFCDVIIAGNDSATALKYDEENMFAPMIVLLEREASAGVLIRTAEKLNVPVVRNVSLAKNLSSHGKSGQAIPERLYRDISLALARLGTQKLSRMGRGIGKFRRGVPIKIPRPLSVELGSSLFAITGEGEGREKLLVEPLKLIRKRLIRLLGITIPHFRVAHNAKLKNDEYRILFKGLEAGRGKLELGLYASAGAQYTEGDYGSLGRQCGFAAKAAAYALVQHASEIVQRRIPELLGRDEVNAILDAAEEKYPVVAGEVKSLLSLGIIREILQSLVSEQVSIRHIAIILETLADWGSFGPAPNDLIIEQIRQSLKRQICLEYADDKLTLRVLTLEPKLEKRFADHSACVSAGVDCADLISSAARGMEEKGFHPVILCSPKARSLVKEATRKNSPNLAVLSYMEIPSDISVEPVGEIRIEGSVRFPENMI